MLFLYKMHFITKNVDNTSIYENKSNSMRISFSILNDDIGIMEKRNIYD